MVNFVFIALLLLVAGEIITVILVSISIMSTLNTVSYLSRLYGMFMTLKNSSFGHSMNICGSFFVMYLHRGCHIVVYIYISSLLLVMECVDGVYHCHLLFTPIVYKSPLLLIFRLVY